ncbi:ATP-binding protein [Anaerobacillus isosaccharinicus]|uniref:histidine kinase n=1 Tax=Anaerobacillus isosaccharinicus TaxID=1532552 RepID=A0A1S2L4R8_9BACI|nr:ATP-binding protein [Anaerobacillus isosaccharinicus]MBA5584980.1 GAF domain-containing protein [Anaerobacillus isosaccharinicus]QOY36666.1 GAF domain-containing protein [Anaerobacillus isosaccharinicus]
MAVIEDKQNMIELLTGVKSSKQSYYMELKKTIRQLEKKNMKLEIINDVMKSFNIHMTMDEMLGNVLEKLKHIITFDRLSLSLFENNELILSNVYPQDLMPVRSLPKKNSLYWQSINRKQPIYYSFSTKEQQLSIVEEDMLRSLNIESVLLIPLISKEAVIGVISFESKRQISYETQDLSFLQQLADQLAVCIDNAKLYNAVLQGKKEWEETFRAVLDMIIFVDMEDTIIRFNDAVPRFFQMDGKELNGQKISRILFQDQDGEEWKSYKMKQPAYCQMSVKNKRICEIYTYPVSNEKDEMYGVIFYMKDVTEKVHTEAQLIHSGKLAAIGEMAAGVAHELNSPLTAILGNSQLLMRQFEKGTSSHQLLQDIKNCGDRCKNIIRNLLTFSRQDQFVLQDSSVNYAVEQVLSLVGYQIERENIRIVSRLKDDLPLVEGSVQQIEQVVINFLLNAKDALTEVDRQEKKIEIETNVKVVDDEEWVYLSVTDNGVGIKEKDVTAIFNPFFTTKESIKGNGLGLSVSLGIAKMHGGKIEVTSVEGKGSCFTLLLPKGEMYG